MCGLVPRASALYEQYIQSEMSHLQLLNVINLIFMFSKNLSAIVATLFFFLTVTTARKLNEGISDLTVNGNHLIMNQRVCEP